MDKASEVGMRWAPAAKGEDAFRSAGWDDTSAAPPGDFLYISQCLHQSRHCGWLVSHIDTLIMVW